MQLYLVNYSLNTLLTVYLVKWQALAFALNHQTQKAMVNTMSLYASLATWLALIRLFEINKIDDNNNNDNILIWE